MEWPDVAVVIITYNRPAEIRETIRGLQKHLNYSGSIKWYLADDGSPRGYVQRLRRDFPKQGFKVSVTNRQGWGGNVNRCLQKFVLEDFIFLIEDDYVAKRPLNLNRGVALLLSNKSLGLVRYDGIAGHNLILNLTETQTPVGRIPYLIISKKSQNLNVYSNRPHLTHRRFYQSYGFYDRKVSLGDTESRYAHRIKDLDGPSLVVLEDGITKAFKHIGKSRQGTALDTNK